MIYMNKSLQSFLGYQEDEVKALNIKRIQPKLIAENHDKFVYNYNESGKSKFLNRLCV